MIVELIDHMGSDLSVSNAARTSFGKEKKVFDEKDAKLIRFLAREKHLLPFRHPQITLRLKVPIFVARQLGKHQTGMSWSEESRRYIDSEPEFYWPETWRKRAENVKQGSSAEAVTDMTVAIGWRKACSPEQIDTCPPELHIRNAFESGRNPDTEYRYFLVQSLHLYQDMLDSGVAPEQARMVLPQSMYTTCVWTGSLLSFVHVIHERTTAGTQKETRYVALQIKDILTQLYPVSMETLLGE